MPPGALPRRGYCVQELVVGARGAAPCLQAAAIAGQELDDGGRAGRPPWHDVAHGQGFLPGSNEPGLGASPHSTLLFVSAWFCRQWAPVLGR